MSTPTTTPTTSKDHRSTSRIDRFLNTIEWLGNKLPEPFALFLGLFLITAVLSTVMAWVDVSVQVPGSDETLHVQGFFTAAGLTWFTTTMAENYIGFPPLLTVLPIMLGVGVAERSGMLSALIRQLFGSARKWVLPYAVGVVGVTASVMADAAWVVVPPLAAMVFKAAGRHPVAGLLGGFASVGAGYSTALVPTSLDALFAGITNAVMDPMPNLGATAVNVLSNYYFNIVAAVLLGVVAGFLIDKVLEPRMWKTNVPTEQVENGAAQENTQANTEDDDQHANISPQLSTDEKRGLWWSLASVVVLTGIVLASVLPEASPWRNEDGGFLPESPLLDSVVFLIFAYFLLMGVVYGIAVGTIRSTGDMVSMMSKAMGSILGFLVLAFILGQFIALFNWSGIGTWTAVVGAAGLESIGLTSFPAIIAFIILCSCVNLLIISGSGMWTLMAAVFVPMFALLGFEPAFIQAAFRVGDSATQVITPLNPFMILIIGMLRKYEPEAGLGTLISRMLPFVVPFWLTWVMLLAVWYFVDLPLGPGVGIFIEG
ncbi:P-aminobenzoyl-glutamate transporter [Corynebacterium yudongzhengii]|uniref:AbgT family transporter n=1 Tax=Corynebacterium yudongzhengii TaxID=2080740 RepID=A0A2U1T956_9CORY|nr:AbgT family transporter [Corynebacterium yudongzhengii]AWB82046.1 P-aminobenzoyl-glutamate transporter [Corynebacterium yudongzhengii]PWC02550.1 AbgT family transporter [Corynebacterium yudongzhengii]